MITEKRKTLKPSRRLDLTLNNESYSLDTFSLKNTVHVLLHKNISPNEITLNSKKLISTGFDNKKDWEQFIKEITHLFGTEKNTRNILLKLNTNKPEGLWINPNYIFDHNTKNTNTKRARVNFNEVSILGLLQEDPQGQSILSKIGLIEPFSDLKDAGNEVKCKIKVNSEEYRFTLNRNTNQFSTWKKGEGGGGAQQFLQKILRLSAQKSFYTLNSIAKDIDLSSLVIKNDSFKFKNSSPLPLPAKKMVDITNAINYFERVRGISPAITKELIEKGAVKYASMIRVSKHTFKDTIRKKRDTKEEFSINSPKSSINGKQIYFPLFDKDDREKSIQFLSTDENQSKAKMNQGTTSGIYSGFKNKGANNYIISEAAFDNFAIYEACKEKINTNNYNFLSCQSVGGVETWIESNFGFSFVKDNRSNQISIKKKVIERSEEDLSDVYIEKFKKEMTGSACGGDKLKSDPRNFVLVYNPSDKHTIEKMKIIEKSLKKIDKSISIDWIESKTRYVKFYDHKPLDIILDSSSLDSWLDANSFTIKNGYIQNEKSKVSLVDITEKDILSFSKHGVESLINATDNDVAGHEVRSLLSLFCQTFGVKFADWSPTHPQIKDHNDCLKLSKNIPVFIDVLQNGEKTKLKIDPSSFKRDTLFDYIDERKIKLVVNNRSKKKIEHKAI